MNQSNQFTATRQCRERNISGYSNTRQHLNNSKYPPTGTFPQSFTHNPNKRKRKESRLPWSASTTARPLRARASCLSSPCVSYTCTSHTRAPPVTLRVLHSHSCSASQQLWSRAGFPDTATATCALSTHTHSLSSAFFYTQRLSPRPLRTAPRPLLSFATP